MTSTMHLTSMVVFILIGSTCFSLVFQGVGGKVWIEEPCTKIERVCEYRPVEKCVTVCKKETRCETYQVTVYKCVPKCHTENYTVCVQKQVPYEATREVCRSVPHQEQVTCCRMVKRIVTTPLSPVWMSCGILLYQFTRILLTIDCA